MKPVDMTAGISMDLLHEKFLTHDLDGKPIYLVRAEAFDKVVRDLVEARTELARLADELAREREPQKPTSWKRPRRW